MKKSITYGILFVMAGILFSACTGGKSMTQRHYNNRYYIGMSKKEKSDPKTDDVSTNNDKLLQDTPAQQELNAKTGNEIITAGNEVSLTEKETQESTSAVTEIQQNENYSQKENIDETTPEKKNRFQKAQQGEHPRMQKISPDKTGTNVHPSDDEAYSLVWIIIILILILWAIGVISGYAAVSALIHLLLLVALILLILWLLRVI